MTSFCYSNAHLHFAEFWRIRLRNVDHRQHKWHANLHFPIYHHHQHKYDNAFDHFQCNRFKCRFVTEPTLIEVKCKLRRVL